jgi:hypothetical protein
VGIVYILSISIGVGGGVIGGVGVHSFIGDGEHWAGLLVQWAFRLVMLRPSSRHSRSQTLVSKDNHVRASHMSVYPAYRVSKWTKSLL